MITEADGFKRVEGGDHWYDGLYATYENTVLLHEQVKELRELLQKLEEEKIERNEENVR